MPSITLKTLSLARRREAPAHSHVLDITVKSGLSVFAPEWDFMLNWKDALASHSVTDPALAEHWGIYTQLYTAKMQHSQRLFPDQWLGIAEHEHVTLACYCPASARHYCHRYLLADMLVDYLGQMGYDITTDFSELNKPR